LRDSPDGVKPYYPYSTLIRYRGVVISSLFMCLVLIIIFLFFFLGKLLRLTTTATTSYAIKGAPGQRLLLEDIYYAIGELKCNPNF